MIFFINQKLIATPNSKKVWYCLCLCLASWIYQKEQVLFLNMSKNTYNNIVQ